MGTNGCKSGLWLCVVASVLSLSAGCGSDPIIYQVTVRDFLPIWCMPFAEFQAADIADVFVSGQGVNSGNNLRDATFANNQGSGVCPYGTFITSGEISGHPDFNRPHQAGWHLQFLYDLEDEFGVNTVVNGTCDLNDVGTPSNRPPNLASSVSTDGRGQCQTRLKNYSPRLNLTMDIAPSGLPKPQYCTSEPEGRCGFFFDNLGNKQHQSANKFFQDMWFLDNKRYNKRIGTTIQLQEESPDCNGVFQFDSATDAENEFTGSGVYAPYGHAEFVFDEAAHPDPFEAKAWPRFTSAQGQVKGNNKFLHTTEVHAFFEYRGDEVFSFSGDDDVWVYINGVMAIELGGLHSRADQLINLGHPFARQYLNITVGEIYTFDLYQAERQPTGSNFKVTSTLSDACNVLTSKKDFFPDADGNSIVRSRGVDFNFVDGSVYAGENIGLLPSGSTDLSTFIFVQEEINVGTGFIIDFKFTANGSPEGFAFVLHQRPEGLTNFPISSGANLGFKGVSNSVAIAFDMCTDRGVGSSCDEQNVTIYYPDNANDRNKPGASTERVYDPIIRSLKFGDEHKVKIAYFFRPPALEVTIDDSLYLREMPFDPVSTLGSIAAFAGFTATAGETAGDITISDWVMQSVDVESSVTTAVDFNNTEAAQVPKTIIGDGEESTGYTIQTRDICLFDIEFGNRAQNTAGKFVEETDPITGLYANNRTDPLIVDAEVVDSDDGTYTYNLKVLDDGIFSLHFFYGDRDKTCTFSVDFLGVVTTGPGSDGCFYGSVLRAVQVFPLTAAPTVGPTVLSLPPTESDDTALFVGAIGGGTLGFLGVIAAVFVIVFRRRWQRDKEFIEEGAAYKLEAITNYNENDKVSVVGRQLLASRAAIMRARAQRDNIQRSKELGALENEQEELQEQIRVAKQRLQSAMPAPQRQGGRPRAPRPERVRKEFL